MMMPVMPPDAPDLKKPKPQPRKKISKPVAVAAVIALATPLVAHFEGKRNYPYRDSVGVLTVCYGHTGGAPNRRYSDAECKAMLDTDEGQHLAPILDCVPAIADKPKVAAASLSMAFNIGSRAFCRSSTARAFNAGQWAKGCALMNRWVYAGGHKLPGLVERRKEESELCASGIK